MPPLTITLLQRNAYRVLGLPASASQLDIDQAARQMRLWDDPAAIPPTDWDKPALGPLPRSRRDVEHAVSLLADPAARAAHRVWWFNDNAAAENSASRNHNRTLAKVASHISASSGDLREWAPILDEVSRASASDEYLAWLLASEAAGQFEKPASPDEISSSLAAMPANIVEGLATSTELDTDDLPRLTTLLKLTRQADAPSASLAGIEKRILDSLDDQFMRRCDQLQENVSTVWSKRAAEPLRIACGRALNDFKKMTNDNQIVELLAHDRDRRDRVQDRAARFLVHLANAREAMNEYGQSQNLLEMALVYAEGSSLEPTIRRQLDAARQHLKRHRAREALSQPAAPSSRAASSSSAGRRSVPWIVIVLGIALFRACISFSSHSSSSSSSSGDYTVDPTVNIDSDEIRRILTTRPGTGAFTRLFDIHPETQPTLLVPGNTTMPDSPPPAKHSRSLQ